MSQTDFSFAITSSENPTVAVKHLSYTADSQEVAASFADQALEEYKTSLSVEPEEFESRDIQ